MTPTLLSLILLATSVPYELTTLDERTVTGELVALTEESVTLSTDEGEQEFAVAQLLSLTPVNAEGSTPDAGDVSVEFAEGTLVRAHGLSKPA